MTQRAFALRGIPSGRRKVGAKSRLFRFLRNWRRAFRQCVHTVLLEAAFFTSLAALAALPTLDFYPDDGAGAEARNPGNRHESRGRVEHVAETKTRGLLFVILFPLTKSAPLLASRLAALARFAQTNRNPLNASSHSFLRLIARR